MPNPEVMAALEALTATIRSRKRAGKVVEQRSLGVDTAADGLARATERLQEAQADADLAAAAVTAALEHYQAVLSETP